MLLCELILPQLTNHYGTLFAPNGLALLGKAAYMAGARYCGQPVVMAAAKQIDFLKPVRVGSLLNLHARVTRVGRSSMTVQATGFVDGAPGASPELVLRGEFELVAVDASGRPCKLNITTTD
jgi:acyl-CoA hydrolase